MNLDASIIKFIYENLHNPFLNQLMVIVAGISKAGLVWITIAVALLISKQYRKVGLMAIAALLLGLVLTEGILKHLINRPRPFVEMPYLQLLIDQPLTTSFPSGHTTLAFAMLGIVVKTVSNKLITIPVVLLGCLIAFSRLYLSVHYPTDVLGGIVMGLGSALIVYQIFGWRKGSKEGVNHEYN